MITDFFGWETEEWQRSILTLFGKIIFSNFTKVDHLKSSYKLPIRLPGGEKTRRSAEIIGIEERAINPATPMH